MSGLNAGGDIGPDNAIDIGGDIGGDARVDGGPNEEENESGDAIA